MAEAQKDSDQSMDDILASIRRIISDDSPRQGATAAPLPEARVSPSQPAPSESGGPVAANSDDLADFIEPASSLPDRAADQANPSTFAAAQTDPAQTPWPFDSGSGAASANVSLKSKLASLDEAVRKPISSQGEATLKQDASARTGDIEVERPTDTISAQQFRPIQEPKANPAMVEDREPEVRANVVAPVAAELEADVAQARAEPSPDRAPEMKDVPGSIEEVKVSTSASDDPVAPEPVAAVAPVVGGVGVSARFDQHDTQAKDLADFSTDAAADEITPSATTTSDGLGDKTLEAVVVDALQPMLSEWLDANLPRLVQEEIERRVRDGSLKG